MSELRKKLDALVSGDESARFLERVKFRKENKAWLNKSLEIAITVSHTLETKKITPEALASRMDTSLQEVDKILKGQENMTLQTISKLEAALGIELINIHFSSATKRKKQHGSKKDKS
jgi:ribosome-binding protein aMBF1 (putative translation factor)